MPDPEQTKPSPLDPAWTSGLLIVLFLGLLTGWRLYDDYVEALAQSHSMLATLARVADEQLSGSLRSIDLLLRDISEESLEKQPEDVLTSFIKARVKGFPEVRQVFVTNAEGIVRATTLSEIRGTDVRQRPYYAMAMAENDKTRLFISAPMQSVTTGATVIFVARVIFSTEGQIEGVVGASLSPAYFEGVLQSVRPENGKAVLFNTEPVIVAQFPDADKYRALPVGQEPAVRAHLHTGARISEHRAVSLIDGLEHLSSVRSLAYPSLYCLVAQPLEWVLVPWQRQVMVQGGAFTLLSLATLFLVHLAQRHETERRRNAERLLQLDSHLRDLGSRIPGAIFQVALDDERQVRCGFVSESIHALTGIPAARILSVGGSPLLLGHVLDPGSETPWAALERAMLQQQEWTCEYRITLGHVTESGLMERWIRARAVPVLRLAHTTHYSGVLIDITESRCATQQLEAGKRLLDDIIASANALIIGLDNHGTIVIFNTQAETTLGYTQAELAGRNWFEVIVPRAHYPQVWQLFEQGCQEGRIPEMFENPVLTKSGEERFIAWRNSTVRDFEGRTITMSFGLDITELKAAEQELRRASDRLTLATRAGGIGVWEWDMRRNVLAWDDRMYALYGQRREDFRGAYEAWAAALLPEDLTRAEEAVAAALHGNKEFDIAFRIVWPDGSRHAVKAAALVERDLEGHPIRMTGVNWDITERQETEAALRTARDQAQAATNAKSAFLANMSHEIRTPLNAIIGMGYLLDRTELAAKQRDYLRKINISARSLLGLINDILDVSKIEAGKLVLEHVEFHLDEVLDRVSSIEGVKAHSKGLGFLLHVPVDMPPLLIGDPMRLGQVLINLVDNAVKFTEHGEVVLTITCQERTTDYVILRFVIRDSGIGMTAEQVSRIFQAFEQADTSVTRRYGGSGLGLAISQRLVAMMGGQLEVDSALGQGSRFAFTISLPCRLTPPRVRAALAENLRGLRVLVVDDSESARFVVRDSLDPAIFRSTLVADGETALHETAAAAAAGDPFRLVLMDWRLDGMDGIEVARRIKAQTFPANTAAPAIIILTGYGDDDMMRHVEAAQLDGLLLKPVSPSMLFDAIVQVVLKETGDSAAAPTLREPPASAAAAGPPSAAAGHSCRTGMSLLVVEDNAINQEVARDILEGMGYSVTIARDGNEAVRLVRAMPATGQPRAFAAVLMDLQMPGMDGYQATRLIRELYDADTLPIIAMTAHAMTEERDRCLQIGMNDHVAKPIEPQCLQAVLEHWLGNAATTAAQESASRPRAGRVPRGAAPTGNTPLFDAASALERLRGNAGLLKHLLRRFCEDYADSAAQIDTLGHAENSEALRIFVHTLKSAAANLGLMALGEAAGHLELQLRQGVQVTEWRLRIPILLQTLALSLDAAARYDDTSDDKPHDPDAPPQSAPLPAVSLSPLNVAAFTRHLAELDTLLARNNLAACTLFQSQMERWRGHGFDSELDTLENCLQRLDFRNAHTVLVRLRQQYGGDDTQAV